MPVELKNFTFVALTLPHDIGSDLQAGRTTFSCSKDSLYDKAVLKVARARERPAAKGIVTQCIFELQTCRRMRLPSLGKTDLT